MNGLNSAGKYRRGTDSKMASVDLETITPEKMKQILEGLSSGTRNTLGQYGTPAEWARAIGSIFANTSSLPYGFFQMDPSAQLEYAVHQIAAAGPMPGGGGSPHSPDGSLTRLAQLLTAHSIKRSDTEAVQSIIEDSNVARRGNTSFLNRQDDAM